MALRRVIIHVLTLKSTILGSFLDPLFGGPDPSGRYPRIKGPKGANIGSVLTHPANTPKKGDFRGSKNDPKK